MLRSWEAVQNGLAGNRAALRLGTQLSIWDGLLVDLAVWLEQAQGGQVPLTLNFDHSQDMGEAVRAGLLDIALATEPVAGLGVERLTDEVLVLVSDQPRTLGKDAPLFINLELGAAYTAGWQAVVPPAGGARQHIVLGSARMGGLDYLLKRGGGIGYFPTAMVAGVPGLHRVAGAPPELHLPCHALFARRSGQMVSVLAGLAELRQAGADQPPGREFVVAFQRLGAYISPPVHRPSGYTFPARRRLRRGWHLPDQRVDVKHDAGLAFGGDGDAKCDEFLGLEIDHAAFLHRLADALEGLGCLGIRAIQPRTWFLRVSNLSFQLIALILSLYRFRERESTGARHGP